MLTFSTGTYDSNKSALLISIVLLLSSIKLYKSLYREETNVNIFYLERNLVSLSIGYFLIVFLVNFGIVMTF